MGRTEDASRGLRVYGSGRHYPYVCPGCGRKGEITQEQFDGEHPVNCCGPYGCGFVRPAWKSSVVHDLLQKPFAYHRGWWSVVEAVQKLHISKEQA